MEAAYLAQFGIPFDRFKVHERGHFDWTHQNYFSNRNFLEALASLGIKELALANKAHINLPWWNEIGLAETEFSKGKGAAAISVGEIHSIETQLVRRGAEIGRRPIVLAGLVRTAPDSNFPNGALVFGLRGGSHFPNLLHVPAGALKRDDQFLSGADTIAGVFQRTELGVYSEFSDHRRGVSYQPLGCAGTNSPDELNRSHAPSNSRSRVRDRPRLLSHAR